MNTTCLFIHRDATWQQLLAVFIEAMEDTDMERFCVFSDARIHPSAQQRMKASIKKSLRLDVDFLFKVVSPWKFKVLYAFVNWRKEKV